MKVLLLKDVYKLGRAGEVKKVANGYARNYLIPRGLAVLATPSALKMAERIKKQAVRQRKELNDQFSALAERLEGMVIYFAVKASEQGKLYGSVNAQRIAEKLTEELGEEITKHQVDTQPLRMLGEYEVPIRLTMDLNPTIKVVIYREGETPPGGGDGPEGPSKPEPEPEPEPEPTSAEPETEAEAASQPEAETEEAE